MHVVVLVSDPAGAAIDAAAVEALRNAWGGGVVTWLSPDRAAEFPIRHLPGNREDVWNSLQAVGIDMAVVPSEGRRKKMLLADMDSTMICQECIDELAAEAGFGARVAAITARAMNGELDFNAALTERVGLLKGLDAGVIDRVIRTRITYMPGGETLLATMLGSGAYTALVSGGFTAFTAVVAGRLGFDEHRANRLGISGGRLTGEVLPPILGRAAKVEALDEITARLGIEEADVIAVGDGANDLGMLARAGMGVALHAKPAVAAQSDLRINHGDLTALLFLQGYRADEFVQP